ncbi:hypothetical protein MMC12_002918, partial [Toensbergia leucococca]|nr:hypothetical protein [Toensbergia leucococca]
VYNKTYIRWTTHRPIGLSAKDVKMAAMCDEHAHTNGEIEMKGDSSRSSFASTGDDLADRTRG